MAKLFDDLQKLLGFINPNVALGVGLTGLGATQGVDTGATREAVQFLRNQFTSPTALSEDFTGQLKGLADRFQPFLTQQRQRGIADIQQRFGAAFPATSGAQGPEFAGLSRFISDEALPREQGLLSNLGLGLVERQSRSAEDLLNFAKPNPLAAAFGNLGGLLTTTGALGLPGLLGKKSLGDIFFGNVIGGTLGASLVAGANQALAGKAKAESAHQQPDGSVVFQDAQGNTVAHFDPQTGQFSDATSARLGAQDAAALTNRSMMGETAPLSGGLIGSPSQVSTPTVGAGIGQQIGSTISNQLKGAGKGAGIGLAAGSAVGAAATALAGVEAGAPFGPIGMALGAIIGGVAGFFASKGSARKAASVQAETQATSQARPQVQAQIDQFATQSTPLLSMLDRLNADVIPASQQPYTPGGTRAEQAIYDLIQQGDPVLRGMAQEAMARGIMINDNFWGIFQKARQLLETATRFGRDDTGPESPRGLFLSNELGRFNPGAKIITDKMQEASLAADFALNALTYLKQKGR